MDKILFLTHWFPSKENAHKGIFIKNHAHCFDAFSDLTVVDFNISFSNKIYNSQIYRSNDDGLDILHINVKSRLYKFLYYSIIFQFFLLKFALKKENVDVKEYKLLVSNVVFPNAILSWKLAKKFKKKLIHIEHWSYLKTFLKKDFHKRKGKKALEYASKILVVSQVIKNELKGYDWSDKIEIIPNVVTDKFEYLPKSKSETIRFLAIANWNKPKNPFLFIDALSKLNNEQDHSVKFKLTMIGEGSQLEEIRKMDLPYEIEYLGIVKNEEIPNHFQQTDFFLHGSDFETFSIVVIESLQTGTPVIGSKVGVLPEVINKENGYICENNVEDWGKSIQIALNCTYDYEKIASQIKGKYDKRNIANSFQTIIKDCINGDN